MALVPQTIVGKIQFYEEHIQFWAANPVAVGLEATDIAAFAPVVAQARADFDAALAARTAAQGATETQNFSVADMADIGAGFIDTIRAHAKKTGDNNVYALAGIPAPQPPTPAGPPDQPTQLTATLLPGGGLRLKWKGSVAQGAYFSVYRKVEGASSFTLLKSPKDKTYDDLSIPGGTTNVTYYIQAIRDTFTVDSAWYQINFGAGGATVTALSMAA